MTFTPLLLPLSALYGTATAIHRRSVRPKVLPATVASVGNLTWGGSGKTPVVIAMSRELSALGIRSAILTRGYGRRGGEGRTITVSDGTRVNPDADSTGDEPLMMALKVPEAVIMSGSNRFRSGMEAYAKYKPGAFILDDGFQHWGLKRDFDIVCVNAINPFGNGHLIPAGILRETPSAVRRADIAVITNSGSVSPEALSQLRMRLAGYGQSRIASADYRITGFRRLNDDVRFDPGRFAGKDAAVVSGVAESRGIDALFSRNGIRITRHTRFGDHHRYRVEDIETAGRGGLPLITTDKDAVKMAGLMPRYGGEIYAAEIEIAFTEGEDIWREIVGRIARYS